MKLWKYSGTFFNSDRSHSYDLCTIYRKRCFFGNAQKWIGKFYWREL